jgi:hypothetical protein
MPVGMQKDAEERLIPCLPPSRLSSPPSRESRFRTRASLQTIRPRSAVSKFRSAPGYSDFWCLRLSHFSCRGEICSALKPQE